MKNFFYGVAITTILWLTCIGLMWVDAERKYTKMQHELSIENYKLRLEIAKIHRIDKNRAWNMVEGRK